METLQREAVYLWYYFDVQFRQIFLYWVLDMVVGSAVSVFLKEQIHDTMCSLGQRKIRAKGVCISSVLGIVSPLCMYGTIPIAASFSKSGVRDDWLAAFMMSSILLNPQLILYSAALGTTVLAVRIVSCFLCGIMAGLCVRWFYKGRSFLISPALRNRKAKILIQTSCSGTSKICGETSKLLSRIFCWGLSCLLFFSGMFRQKS